MRRLITLGAVLGVGAMAWATGAAGTVFVKTYKIDKTSSLGKAACAVCHKNKHGGPLNPYGKDLEKAMKTLKVKKVTAEVLQHVEGLDSTKTGKTNLQKIQAGKNPGVD